MKKMLLLTIAIIVIIGSAFAYVNFANSKAEYKIIIEKIDDKSPDRKVKVLKNKKEIDFTEIRYNVKEKVVLCTGANPTINMFDTNDYTEYIVVLKNKKEVLAQLIVEEEKNEK